MENGTNGSAALVKHGTMLASSAYEPRNPQEAHDMAKHFAGSKLLGELSSADQVFLVMATGHDLGIPATTALRAIHIVKSKPVLSADLIKAICLRRRDICEHFRLVKSDDKIATYSAKRVGDEPVVMSFTMDDAVKAKLATKGDDSNWSKYGSTMLRHRCTAMIAREVFPDLVLGVYCEEEAAEIAEDTRVHEALVIDQEAVDGLEARTAAYAARIESVESMDALKAVATEIGRDPAASEIKERVTDVYKAKKAALEAA